MEELKNQKYPLSVDYQTASEIVNEMFTLVKMLRGDRELSQEEYRLLNKITTSLVHPTLPEGSNE